MRKQPPRQPAPRLTHPRRLIDDAKADYLHGAGHYADDLARWKAFPSAENMAEIEFDQKWLDDLHQAWKKASDQAKVDAEAARKAEADEAKARLAFERARAAEERRLKEKIKRQRR